MGIGLWRALIDRIADVQTVGAEGMNIPPIGSKVIRR